MLVFCHARLGTWLTGTATAVLSADIALWLVSGQPGSLSWSLFGAAAGGLGLTLAVTLAAQRRRLSAQSLTHLRANLRAARQRGTGRVPREIYDSALFYERLDEEVRLSIAHDLSLGLIVLRIRRSSGPHVQGDVIASVRSAARQRLRSSDIAGQLGEHWFALLLPETDRRGALLVGARLIGLLEGVAPGTIGVAVFPEDATSPQKLVESARRRAVPYGQSEAA